MSLSLLPNSVVAEEATGSSADGTTSEDENIGLISAQNDNGENSVDGSPVGETVHNNHCICGSHDISGCDGTELEWTEVSSLDDINVDGNYYLKNPITLTGMWTCKYNVNLCLNGQTITGASGQHVIKIDDDKSLLITDCHSDDDAGKITNSSSGSGYCGIVNNGTLTLWNGIITGNHVGVHNNNYGGVFTMNGGSITGNGIASDGAGVSNEGNFVMNGGSITDNTAGEYGGGVYNCGTLTATGGNITGNRAGKNGGGVYNEKDGTLSINGAANISGNTGGNVFINNGAVITSSGLSDGASVGIAVANSAKEPLVVSGTTETAGFVSDDLSYELTADSENNGLRLSAHKHCICGGDAEVGDHTSHTEIRWTGITSLDDIKADGNYVLKSDIKIEYPNEWICNYVVNLCLNGHDIIRNYHNQVIEVASGKSLNITDCHSGSEVGKITHGTEWAGTGIVNYGSLTFWNGSVTGNDDGGVVNARNGDNASIFKMYGGAISGNSGFNTFNDVYGGGVSNFRSTFEMYGGTISDNTAIEKEAGYGGGVYNDYYSTFIMTGGSITGNRSSNGGGVYSVGTFKVSGAPVITGNTNGTAAENVYLEEDETIIAKSTLDSAANIGITGTLGKTVVTGTIDKTGFYSDDTYALAANKDNTGLMLKAHTHCVCGKDDCEGEGHDADAEWKSISDLSEITENGNYVLKSDITLTETWTCNYSVNLCLNGKNIIGAKDNATISIANGASFAITDCHSDEQVGTITHKSGEMGTGINNNGTLTIWNGSVAGNYGGKTAGGVNNTGTFYVKGGSITGNSASEKGGGVYNAQGTFNMDGGSITENTVEYLGGGVYNNSDFTMTGGDINGNTARYYGGGIANYGTFNFEDGLISNNTSSFFGGGVYNNSVVKMSGGSISGNSAGGKGGGIYAAHGLAISGKVIITDNNGGGNVYLNQGNISAGTMTEGSVVGITASNPADSPVVVNGSTDTTIFVSDDSEYETVVVTGYNKLKLSKVTRTGMTSLSQIKGDGNTNNSGSAVSAASTGDETGIAFWLMIMLIGGAGVAGTATFGKRKKH